MVHNINLVGISKTENYFNKKNKKNMPERKEISNTTTINDLKGIPYSYISFKGISNLEDSSFTKSANELISNAKEIAIKNGNDSITPHHIIHAAILILENSNTEDKNFTTIEKLANEFAKHNIFENESEINYFIEITSILKANGLATIKSLPTNKTSNNIDLSEDLKASLEDIKKDTNRKLDDYVVLGTSFNLLSGQTDEYTNMYLNKLKTLSYYNPIEEIFSNYLNVYDKKAIDVWNKLALGNNLIITSGNIEERKRLEASFLNTINQTKYGNFNNKNTIIYSIADNIDVQTLIEEINIQSLAQPDSKLIYTIDLDNILLNSTKKDETGNQYIDTTFLDFINNSPTNIKFILMQNSNNNAQLMAMPEIKNFLNNYLSYNIPPIHAHEVPEILKKNKDLLTGLDKTFTKDAKDKIIQLANKMSGIYPDKAIILMNNISDFYGNNITKVTLKDVEKYANLAKDLFFKEEQGNNIIYDTGKNLSSYYGKETTKKDIENIVKLIKTGRLGSQGLIISAKDSEAGSGRKYTAKVIAGEAKVPFLEVNSSEFSNVIYDSNNNALNPTLYLKKIFKDIKNAATENQYKTAILYINNFDDMTIYDENLYYKQCLTQLSKEIEQAIDENINILVIGGVKTNTEKLIPLFIKDFSQNIVVDSPAFEPKSRKEIIKSLLDKKNIMLTQKTNETKDNLINKLVKITEYFSYVDIKTLIQKSEQIMLERGKKKAGIGEFIEAFLQIQTGRTSLPNMPDYNKKCTTSHECGHALNLEVMNNLYNKKGQPWFKTNEVNFITLDPRGNFLGAVFEGQSENHNYPFEAMFADLVCAYGGYSCEKTFFNMDGSSGIAQDLAQATSFAKRGIEYFGLGYNTGKISKGGQIHSGHYDENVYKDLEVILTNAQTVSDLITEQYQDFNKIFTKKYSKLIGTENCMIDGDDFRKQLKNWIESRSDYLKDELNILDEMIMDIIKASKNGKIYTPVKKVIL